MTERRYKEQGQRGGTNNNDREEADKNGNQQEA